MVVDSIGFSVQNRALWEITISNQPESSSHHRIYIHARTHPGEEESFWVTKEIINILVSNSQFAESIRSNFIFHIIPKQRIKKRIDQALEYLSKAEEKLWKQETPFLHFLQIYLCEITQ